jgi:hypothetical protein
LAVLGGDPAARLGCPKIRPVSLLDIVSGLKV